MSSDFNTDVPGQIDDLIIGTNVIKFLTHKLKESDEYWKVVSTQGSSGVGGDRDDFVARDSSGRVESPPTR